MTDFIVYAALAGGFLYVVEVLGRLGAFLWAEIAETISRGKM